MLVRSTCSRDSSSYLVLWCHIWTKDCTGLFFLCYFLCVSAFWKSAGFSHSTPGVFLIKHLLLHALFLFFNIINSVRLFWCIDSSRTGSMKQTFHQHRLYWLEPGAELELDLLCFLLVCFGFKKTVCHFYFAL